MLDRLLFVPTCFHGLDFRAFQPWQLSFAMLFAMLYVTAPLRLNCFPPNWVRGAESIWIIPSVPTPKYPTKAGWQLPRRIESTMLHSRSPRRDSREGSCKASSSGCACTSRGRSNIIRAADLCITSSFLRCVLAAGEITALQYSNCDLTREVYASLSKGRGRNGAARPRAPSSS